MSNKLQNWINSQQSHFPSVTDTVQFEYQTIRMNEYNHASTWHLGMFNYIKDYGSLWRKSLFVQLFIVFLWFSSHCAMYLPGLCKFWRWNPPDGGRINIYFCYFVFTSRVKNAVFSHWNKVLVNNHNQDPPNIGNTSQGRGRVLTSPDQTDYLLSTARQTDYRSLNSPLTWPQIFFGDLQVFVLSVAFVTTMGMVVMVAPSIMSSLVIPLLAGQMEAHQDVAVAGDLVVAQFVIWGTSRNIIFQMARLESSQVSPSGLCLAAGSLAASSWSQGLPSITQGLQHQQSESAAKYRPEPGQLPDYQYSYFQPPTQTSPANTNILVVGLLSTFKLTVSLLPLPPPHIWFFNHVVRCNLQSQQNSQRAGRLFVFKSFKASGKNSWENQVLYLCRIW